MGHVTEVRPDERPPAVLTDTEMGGLFGSKLVADQPLAAYLQGAESARYVLRNKSDGVTIEDGESSRVAEPGDDFQALAAVTDLRVLFVVGRADGDMVYSVSLGDVVSVETDGGMVTDELWITTTDETRYGFACRGDLSDVAAAIDGTAQAWARAYRLLDEADEQLATVDDHVEADDYEAALSAAEDALDAVETARNRMAEEGEEALATFDDEAGAVRERARTRTRSIHAAHGDHLHSVARDRWREGEYEQAYDLFETALEAFQAARRSPGDAPSGQELADEAEQVRTEREELQRVPLARAEQLAQGAESVDAHAPAARRWERAIERFRGVLWLDWGREQRRFDGDPDVVRERIVDAVDHLVTSRRGAASACRETARDHLMAGEHEAARRAYRTALEHLAAAQEIVDEVAPNRETGLDDTVGAVEDELATVDETEVVPAPGNEGTDPDVARDADAEAVADAVAAHWRDHGWEAEVVDGDVVATIDRPVSVRVHASVLHRPGEQVGPPAIEAVRDDADDAGAHVAVLATTGELTDGARDLATESGVELLDPTWLLPARTASSDTVPSA